MKAKIKLLLASTIITASLQISCTMASPAPQAKVNITIAGDETNTTFLKDTWDDTVYRTNLAKKDLETGSATLDKRLLRVFKDNSPETKTALLKTITEMDKKGQQGSVGIIYADRKNWREYSKAYKMPLTMSPNLPYTTHNHTIGSMTVMYKKNGENKTDIIIRKEHFMMYSTDRLQLLTSELAKTSSTIRTPEYQYNGKNKTRETNLNEEAGTKLQKRLRSPEMIAEFISRYY